jgi:hypothetical protein
LETATPPFTGDLENPLYVSITTGMRNFNPDLYVPAEEKPEGE